MFSEMFVRLSLLSDPFVHSQTKRKGCPVLEQDVTSTRIVLGVWVLSWSLFFGDRGVLLELARKLNDLSKYVEKTLLDVMNTKRSKVDLRWKVSPRFRRRWM